MRNKYKSYLKPSGEISDIMTGKDIDQYGPATGFTGRGPGGNTQLQKPAGVVHQGEYVVDAAEVNNMGGPQGVKNAINQAQVRTPKLPEVKYDPSKNPTKNLNMSARGPQSMPSRPARDEPIGKLSGFDNGGYVGMQQFHASSLTGARFAADLDYRTNKASTINPTGTQGSNGNVTGGSEVTSESQDLTTVDSTSTTTPPTDSKPPDTGTGTGLDENLTKIKDTVDNIVDTYGSEDFVDNQMANVDIADIKAPTYDPEIADVSDRLINWKKDFGDLTMLPESERSKMYAALEDVSAERYRQILDGEDPLFEQLSLREKDTLAGVLNARRGKQSQIAAQLGMTGGELNAHYASISRNQELMGLNLQADLAKQQLARVDHANDQLAKMANDVQTREDTKQKWGSEFNLAVANFGLNAENYNRLLNEFAANYIKDYERMGLDAQIADQVNKRQFDSLRKGFVELSANIQMMGADLALDIFREQNDMINNDMEILANRSDPESQQAFQALVNRYHPEWGDITSGLIGTGYEARWAKNASDLIVAIKESSYEEVANVIDDNNMLTETGMSERYTKDAINMWNSQHQLSEGDEGYINPNDYAALKSNKDAFEWVSDEIYSQNLKRTAPYVMTHDWTQSELYGLVDDFGYIDPETGDFVNKFGSEEALDDFEYLGKSGTEAIRYWYADAFKNNVIYRDEDGDLKINTEDPMLSAFGLEGLGTEEGLAQMQMEKYTKSGGWPASIKDKTIPIIVTNELTGTTKEYKYGEELPISLGDNYTMTHDGKPIEMDKEFVNWKKDNPNVELTKAEADKPFEIELPDPPKAILTRSDFTPTIENIPDIKSPVGILTTNYNIGGADGAIAKPTIENVITGQSPITIDAIKSVSTKDKLTYANDFQDAVTAGATVMNFDIFTKGVLSGTVASVPFDKVPLKEAAQEYASGETNGGYMYTNGEVFKVKSGFDYEYFTSGGSERHMDFIELETREGRTIYKNKHGEVFLVKPDPVNDRDAANMSALYAPASPIKISKEDFTDPAQRELFYEYYDIYNSPDNQLKALSKVPAERILPLLDLFKNGMNGMSETNQKRFTEYYKHTATGGVTYKGSDVAFVPDENGLPRPQTQAEIDAIKAKVASLK